MAQPQVYIVGGGPGHPGLLTLRAVECLRRADVVLYDRSLLPILLDHAAPGAELVCVTGPGAGQTLLSAARAGRRVVRLQEGDASQSGSAGRDAEALRRAKVDCEIVPGVSATFGAAEGFERLPLFGRGVLVTRPRRQAAEMLSRLRELGAVAYLMPTVEVRDPPDWAPVDRALAELERYQWLVFTSSNGVEALLRRLFATGRDLRALGSVRLAVIGPSTGAALRAHLLQPDFMPATYNSEALAAGLKERAAGQRVLLARADRGRDVLRQELSAVATVEQVAVYSQVDSVAPQPAVLDALRDGDIPYVTLTSSNIARSLARAVDDATRARIRSGAVQLVTISGVTSADVRELSWPVAAEAKEATVDGVVAALVELAKGASTEVTQRVPAHEQDQSAGEEAEDVHGGA
jgi:uroporphyrinogen III methyltransferase/synthase